MTTRFTDRWSFIGVLASEDVSMYLDDVGNLRSRGKISDPEIVGFIRKHRDAIIAELREKT